MQFDVFICHASEDKEDFVRPLAERLKHYHIEVWYDEFSLTIGDSLSQKIDEGLSKSRFGIVVFSPNFFKKPWAKRELMGLTAREMNENKSVILPIWHRVGVKEVLEFSPPLADKKAASSSDGINAVIREIARKIRPDESPLVVARDHLVQLGLDPPPISDEWWLDIVEYKEFLKFPDINVGKRWIFPLPYPNEETGRERGINIASTALQLDWAFEGEELNIGPTTHPEKILEYLHRWPGLYDCARENPALLALYAPQLTIPGFDAGFEDVFDRLLIPNNKEAERIFSYGRLATVDSGEPLCGDIISLRHPTFGNYSQTELGRRYFDAHDGTYIRSHFDPFEGLVWLVSCDSEWLPQKYRDTFIRGILDEPFWVTFSDHHDNPFLFALGDNLREQFQLTNVVLDGLATLVTEARKNLKIEDSIEDIVAKLMTIDIIKCFYDSQDWMTERTARNHE